MGNGVSCFVPHDSPSGIPETIRLVQSDGKVRILDKSLSAGEVMKEFPDHLVCHSDSFYIGQKIPALSAMDELKMGHKYFLLPKQSFQSVLSIVSLASLISRSTGTGSVVAPIHKNCIGRASLLVSQPFEIQKSAVGGGLQIKVSSEFVSKLIEGGKLEDTDSGSGSLCNTPELQKDYEQLVTSRNQTWRPKLDTITEGDDRGNNGYRRFRIDRRTRSFTSMNEF